MARQSSTISQSLSQLPKMYTNDEIKAYVLNHYGHLPDADKSATLITFGNRYIPPNEKLRILEACDGDYKKARGRIHLLSVKRRNEESSRLARQLTGDVRNDLSKLKSTIKNNNTPQRPFYTVYNPHKIIESPLGVTAKILDQILRRERLFTT